MGYYVGPGTGEVLGSPLTAAVGLVPGGNVANVALSLFSGIFGTSQDDKDRMARVQYFYNLAAGGNVAAAQEMAGAIFDVADDEKGYWQKALQQLATANPAVSQAAAAGGPIRTTGLGDTAKNYPHMQAIALNWAAANPPVGNVTTLSPGGQVVSRASTLLPGMTSTAPYNWTPVLVGVGSAAVLASVLFGGRRRNPPRRRVRR